MTRAMLVTVLYRMAGSPEVDSSTLPFTDLKADAWYTDAVIWSRDRGVVNGYEDGRFGVSDSITREQLAAILYRYTGAADTGGSLAGWSDASGVSSWAVQAMSWAVDRGLITGMSDSTLAPRGTATRAQTAAILMRYLQQ